MTAEVRKMEPLRATPVLVGACLIQVAAVLLFLVNVAQQRTSPILAWGLVMAAIAVAGRSCWQASAGPGGDRTSQRLWRQLTLVCALAVAGTAGDARQSVVHPERMDQKQHDPVTSAVYVLAVLVVLWALLRLPAGRRGQQERMFRFILDAATVSITVGIFALYFASRMTGPWSASNSTIVPTILLASLGLIGSLAFVKVGISGLGGLDRHTVRLLGAAAAVSAVGGGLFPLLVDVHSGLSGSQIFVPGTMLFVAFAADRQRRATGVPRPEQRTRYMSNLPFLAVAATDGLLLLVSHRADGMVATV